MVDEKITLNVEDFWKRTNKLLRDRGYTQNSLSLECGFTENRITNWASKKTLPNVFEAYEMATRLGVTLDYFITGDEDSKTRTVKKQIKDLLHQLERNL